MQLHVQKSIISNIISGARATLNEPSRPFTPADLPRHLFSGNDYSERPGSAYKIGQVANDAIETFTRSSTSESNIKGSSIRPRSRQRGNPILEPIVRKKDSTKMNKIVLKTSTEDSKMQRPFNNFKGGQPVKIKKTSIPNGSPIKKSKLKSGKLNLADCELGNSKMHQNQSDALRKQEELMESMQKARTDYDNNVDDLVEDDMEQQFLENMSNELVANAEIEGPDKYVQVLDKLEEIKNNQYEEEKIDPAHKEEHTDEFEYPEEYPDVYDTPNDYLEEKLMKDINKSLQDEKCDNPTNNTFKNEYASLIQEFSNSINLNRKKLPLIKISELTDRVWNMIDDWRNNDQQTTED
jgi:hypothetical protein